jgi:hypothetical protein
MKSFNTFILRKPKVFPRVIRDVSSTQRYTWATSLQFYVNGSNVGKCVVCGSIFSTFCVSSVHFNKHSSWRWHRGVETCSVICLNILRVPLRLIRLRACGSAGCDEIPAKLIQAGGEILRSKIYNLLSLLEIVKNRLTVEGLEHCTCL